MASQPAAAQLPACLLPPFPQPLEIPVNLEGVDLSLSTEVLPAPPPLFGPNSKRTMDHIKKGTLPSYLPSVDPGSTYLSGTGVNPVDATPVDEDEVGSKRKRQRTDKAESSTRPPKGTQDAPTTTFRSSPPPMTGSSSEIPSGIEVTPQHLTSLPSEGISDPPRTNIPPHVSGVRSRRSSGLLAASRLSQLDWSLTVNPKRKIVDGQDVGMPDAPMDGGADKGKGKERALVEDEHPNNTDCSTCKTSILYSTGALLCDSCPLAFHLWCVDPPVDQSDLKSVEEWHCPRCMAARSNAPAQPTSKKDAGFFAELIDAVSSELPSTYELPEEIRNHFRDVDMAVDGSYLDMSEIRGSIRPFKPMVLEDRDPYRLRDRQGMSALCYKCGLSAGPIIDTLPSASKRKTTAVASTPDSSIGRRSMSHSRRTSLADELYPASMRGGSSTVMEPSPDGALTIPESSSTDLSSHSPSPSVVTISGEPPAQVARRRSSRRPVPVNKNREPRLIVVKTEPLQVDLESAAAPAPGLRLNPIDTSIGWRAMIACDHCSSSWHLDCLDPPMVTLPPPHKKWMCPNHAEHALPKRRIPRQMKTITLGSNPNGSSTRRPSYNIEVIPAPDDPTPSPLAPGTSSSADPRGLKRKRSEGEPGPRVVPTPAAASLKYRKPELAIRVDFWNFTQRRAKEKAAKTAPPPPPEPTVDKAALLRERARRTLASESPLSSLSSSPSESDDEPAWAKSLRMTKPAPDLGAAVEALLAMKTYRSDPVRISEGVQTLTLNGGSSPSKRITDTVRTALQAKAKPPSIAVIPASPSKSGGTGFKIRIPALANRVANGSVSASPLPPASSSAANGKPAAAPRRSGRVTNSTAPEPPSTPIRQTTQPSTAPDLSPDEIKSLLAVRELMKAKGEKELMDWLKS